MIGVIKFVLEIVFSLVRKNKKDRSEALDRIEKELPKLDKRVAKELNEQYLNKKAIEKIVDEKIAALNKNSETQS